MGRDKALMTLDGVTLLTHARALLRDAGAASIAVAGRADVEGGLPDLRPGGGPARATSDALLALADAGHGLALVIPVDMPLLTVAALDPLIAGAAAGAAAYEGHPLPLCARLDAHTLAAAQPDSMNDLLAALSAIRLPADDLDPLVLTNVNTPEDWARLAAARGA